MSKAIGIISANYRSDLLETLTAERPIASIPFAGRYRLIDFPLSSMVNSGIRTVGVITPYRFRSIFDHLGAGKEWSLDRKTGGLFIMPGATPDLQFRIYKFCLKDFKSNLEFLLSDTADYVVITGCNYVYNTNFETMIEEHEKAGAEITLVYKEWPKSVPNNTAFLRTREDGFVESIQKAGERYPHRSETAKEENKHFADTFIFNRTLLIRIIESCVDANFTDLLDVVEANLNRMKVFSYEMPGYLGQIYSLADYYRCSMDILDLEVRREIFMGRNKIYTKIKDNPPTKYGPRSQAGNALISSGCIINGEVSDSIIFRGCEIDKGAIIRDSIIMQNCIIGPGAVVEHAIFDKNVEIGSNIVLKGQKYRPLLVPKHAKL